MVALIQKRTLIELNFLEDLIPHMHYLNAHGELPHIYRGWVN